MLPHLGAVLVQGGSRGADSGGGSGEVVGSAGQADGAGGRMRDLSEPGTIDELRGGGQVAHSVDGGDGDAQFLAGAVDLLHGAGDNIIPSAETEWMASELPRGSLKAVLISPVLSHLDMDAANPTMLDQLQLVHFFAKVLHAAEVQ